MQLTLDLNPDEFDKLLREAANEAVTSALKDAASSIKVRVAVLVDQAVRASSEWESLIGGALREEFGIPDARPVLENILKTIKDNIRVDLEAAGLNYAGKLTITLLRGDFRDILAVPGASYISKGKRYGDHAVDWLSWLLFRGSDLILTDTEINLKRASRKGSRTGRAIMVHPRARPSVGWHVPVEFAGTVDSNFLTRALEAAEIDILDVVFEEVQKRMSD